MTKKKIYLAGPITGLTWGETEGWRDRFIAHLRDTSPNVEAFSPLRDKMHLQEEGPIKDNYPNTLFASSKAIMSRDFFDVQTSDAIVANFTNAKKVSIGTVMEVAWGYQRRIPVIVIAEKGNIHEHSMMGEAANWWVETEDEALAVIHALFNV